MGAMCCINRQKDDLNASISSASKPQKIIQSRPGLVRVLNWFDDIEDLFRESMKEVECPLREIIADLDEHCEEEVIELSRGNEIMAKVVDQEVVEEILQFSHHSTDTMRRMLESIEFFKVESQADDNYLSQFDFNKIILFCLLFSNESPREKIECLFYLICDENDQITSNSDKVKTIIAMLTIISCMIPSELIKMVSLHFAQNLNQSSILFRFSFTSILGQTAEDITRGLAGVQRPVPAVLLPTQHLQQVHDVPQKFKTFRRDERRHQ